MDSAEQLTCTAEEYREHPAIAQSDLKLFMRSRQLYYQRKIARTLPDDPPTEAMRWGTAVETMLRCGLEAMTARVVKIPASALNADGHRKGKAWTEWRTKATAEFPGCDLMTPAEYDAAFASYERVLEQVQGHAAARRLLLSECGPSEPFTYRVWQERLLWPCPLTGFVRKAELDLWLADGQDRPVIVDIKTTTDNSADGFCRQIANYRYDIQAATYLESLAAYTQLDVCSIAFVFVAISNKPPYDVAVYEIDTDWLEVARTDAAFAMGELARCTSAKHFTHHDGRAVVLSAPGYARYQHMQAREIGSALSEVS